MIEHPQPAFTPDLNGVAKLMQHEAGEAQDQFQYSASQLLLTIDLWHEPDESHVHCQTCWDHGEDFRAHWPCDTYQAATRFALGWLMRRDV